MQCKNSFWESCKLQKTAFTRVDFTDAAFFRTALAGIDVSGCELTGLKLNPEDIRGAKMSADQAMEFIRLLGIQIL